MSLSTEKISADKNFHHTDALLSRLYHDLKETKMKKEENPNQGTEEEISAVKSFHLTDALLSRLNGDLKQTKMNDHLAEKIVQVAEIFLMSPVIEIMCGSCEIGKHY